MNLDSNIPFNIEDIEKVHHKKMNKLAKIVNWDCIDNINGIYRATEISLKKLKGLKENFVMETK